MELKIDRCYSKGNSIAKMSREIRAYAGNRRVSTAVILSDGTLLQVYPRKARKCVSFEDKNEWFEEIWDKYDDAVFVTEGPSNFDVVLYEQREEEEEKTGTGISVGDICTSLLMFFLFTMMFVYVFILLKLQFPEVMDQLKM